MANIKKLVAKYLGPQSQLGITAATLTLYTRGTRDAGALAGGTQPTSTDYTCKAFVEPITRLMDGSLVTEGRSVLAVLGGSLASGIEPKPGATIVHASVTYKVTRVVSDPVGAVYQCEVAH